MSLPTPPEWPRERVVDHVAPVIHAIFATVLLVKVLSGRVTGPRAPWILLSACVYVSAYLALPRRTRPVTAGGALVFATSRMRTALVVAQLLVADLGIMLLAGSRWRGVAGVAVVASTAYIVGNLLLEVALDPAGVTVRTPRRRRHVPWPEVNEVMWMPRPGLLRLGFGRLNTRNLPVDPVVLYWTVQHYAACPQDRDELADGRAAERVRAENVAGAVEEFEMADAP